MAVWLRRVPRPIPAPSPLQDIPLQTLGDTGSTFQRRLRARPHNCRGVHCNYHRNARKRISCDHHGGSDGMSDDNSGNESDKEVCGVPTLRHCPHYYERQEAILRDNVVMVVSGVPFSEYVMRRMEASVDPPEFYRMFLQFQTLRAVRDEQVARIRSQMERYRRRRERRQARESRRAQEHTSRRSEDPRSHGSNRSAEHRSHRSLDHLSHSSREHRFHRSNENRSQENRSQRSENISQENRPQDGRSQVNSSRRNISLDINNIPVEPIPLQRIRLRRRNRTILSPSRHLPTFHVQRDPNFINRTGSAHPQTTNYQSTSENSHSTVPGNGPETTNSQFYGSNLVIRSGTDQPQDTVSPLPLGEFSQVLRNDIRSRHLPNFHVQRDPRFNNQTGLARPQMTPNYQSTSENSHSTVPGNGTVMTNSRFYGTNLVIRSGTGQSQDTANRIPLGEFSQVLRIPNSRQDIRSRRESTLNPDSNQDSISVEVTMRFSINRTRSHSM